MKKMIVELEWDEKELGEGWMNIYNAELCFYSKQHTKRDLLKITEVYSDKYEITSSEVTPPLKEHRIDDSIPIFKQTPDQSLKSPIHNTCVFCHNHATHISLDFKSLNWINGDIPVCLDCVDKHLIKQETVKMNDYIKGKRIAKNYQEERGWYESDPDLFDDSPENKMHINPTGGMIIMDNKVDSSIKENRLRTFSENNNE